MTITLVAIAASMPALGYVEARIKCHAAITVKRRQPSATIPMIALTDDADRRKGLRAGLRIAAPVT
jgi:hypothetical protein